MTKRSWRDTGMVSTMDKKRIEEITYEVLKSIGGGEQPTVVGRSMWRLGDQNIHTRVVSQPTNGREYGFNINKTTLMADYETWICKSSQDFYLLPVAIVREMYDHPEAYVDQHHPNMRIVKVNLRDHQCRYARGGLKCDLRAYYQKQLPPRHSEDMQEFSFAEVLTDGRIRWALRKHRSREQRGRKKKIDHAMAKSGGHLQCEVPGCRFDFVHVYGELGHRFIHVHHNVALASHEGPVETSLDDLTVVCPNCHAMIHRWMKRHPDETCPLERLVVTVDPRAEPGR